MQDLKLRVARPNPTRRSIEGVLGEVGPSDINAITVDQGSEMASDHRPLVVRVMN